MKPIKPSILAVDEELIVINKPPKFLSVPDRFDPNLLNLKHYFKQKYGLLWPVHRLDKDTSGIIVMARNATAHRELSGQFAAHTPRKTYFAIVEGCPSQQSGRISYALAEDVRKPGRMVVSNKGMSAETTFEVIEQFQHFALLRLNLLTGRTHQIRVHLQAIGHPIVGDPFYGVREAFYLSSLKKRKYQLGKNETERPLLNRTALHAGGLVFTHPSTKEEMSYQADWPKDMRALRQQLNKLDV